MGEQNLVHTPLLHYILLMDIADGQKRRVSSIGTPVSFSDLCSSQPLRPDAHCAVLEHCYLLRWQSGLSSAHNSVVLSGIDWEDSPRAKQLILDILFVDI